MKNNIKIFEIRKEIVNKLKDEAKEDIVNFLLENPFNTIDFTSNIMARGKYHREKIGDLVTEDDLTNEELKDLYFSKEYEGKFFNEIICDKIFRRKIFVKPSKESDFGSYYKNKYTILTGFLENIFKIKTLENMSYYESYEKFLKTLSLEEVFEKLKEKKCNIYCETNINYEKKYKRIKNVDELMKMIFEELNKIHKREISNIENCLYTFYEDIKNKIGELEFEEKEKQSSNPFGYKRVSNEILANKIKNMRETDFSKHLYDL